MIAHGRVITVGSGAQDDLAGRMVARALLAEGMPVASRQIADEDEAALGPALEAALAAPGLVVVLDAPGGSGGEIVRRVLARLAGARLVLSDRLLTMLEAEFSRRGQAMPRRLDRLALLPQGAELWPAADGAPGWALEIGRAVAAVLPQESASLPAMVEERVRPLARGRLAGEARLVRTLLTAGLSAADAEERLGPWLGREGPVLVSTLVADGDVAVRLTARGASRQAAERALDAVDLAVREALGEDCFGRDPETLAAVVGSLLLEGGLTVSVAESGTGGLLGHHLTSLPGASRFFERGVIVASDRAAEALAGVPEALLRAHGSVSAPVAAAMAAGISRLGGSSCGLAVTRVAGLEGDIGPRPAGTVFVACAVPSGAGMPARSEVRRCQLRGGRDAIRRQAAQAALDLMRRALGRNGPAAAE